VTRLRCTGSKRIVGNVRESAAFPARGVEQVESGQV
jgi:hypothetical protein